ncbi:cupin domain-containing protein [Loktanella sp. SALINAS62]|uniref:cupin domain-containing protein n=1 Tax=Loktanella sp. SALINAS62 TaxID=2706124 RepID=UPI001B8B1901|nr:cupin domain-containing protein [Loktanella sp. SALINAS62]MBS1302218.1 cupin domain-containing protein [Loktanella sp. SALINAS62]
MDILNKAMVTVANADHAPLEGFDDPSHGTVQWRTLFSGDRTQTASLTLGVAEFGPQGTLHSHRHSPCEFYFCLAGQGIVTIDGIDHDLRPGIALYIPADAEHCVVAGEDGLRFLYGFPQDRFSDIEYRFSAGPVPVMQAEVAM